MITPLLRATGLAARVPLAVTVGLLACGCGAPEPEPGGARKTGTITGNVLLGPQCPVEIAGKPCPDKQAAGVTVIVSEQLPGEAYAAGPEVARTTTNTHGHFLIEVEVGDYVVTAAAGMSCELMNVRVVAGAQASADIPCDTGVR